MHVFIYRIDQNRKYRNTETAHDRYALNQVIVATRFRRLNKICFWKLWYTENVVRKAGNTHIVVIPNKSDNRKSSAAIA